MGFVGFFIRRPIFATVVALITVLLGAIAIPLLPVAQFPQVTPPAVSVSATYPGAAAEVVEQAVTQPLEQQINGVEGMRYMSSTSSSDGSTTINITFEQGYDQNIAAVDVQNRVALATARLPEEVTRQGVTVRKQSNSFTLIAALVSPDKSRDEVFLSNYATINVIDALNRVDGVSEARLFSSRDYSMRAWIDPDKLSAHGLTPDDVVAAIRSQNIQASLGRVGSPPTNEPVAFEYAMVTDGGLVSVEEFENVVVATAADDTIVRLRDVARVELGAESYTGFKRVDGEPVATIGVFQLPEANALDVANAVAAELDRLEATLPPGVEISIPVDPTTFVRESILEVLVTVGIAVVLVILVTYLFMGRAVTTIVPAVTIPVALVGAFGLIWVMNFSINTLTLFGLVLAIGIVVDDAIVVVENIDRLGREEKIWGRKAAVRAMRDVTAPVIATSVVLGVVFAPAAAVPGLTGQLYRQFALTIIAAVALSTLNALTLSPALSALLLRKPGKMSRPLAAFSRVLDRVRSGYERILRVFVRHWIVSTAIFLGMSAFTVWLALVTPQGFLPSEDQGYFLVMGRTPDASSVERTDRAAHEVERALESVDGIRHYVTVGGFDIRSGRRNATDAFTIFVSLQPWEDRDASGRSLEVVLGEVRSKLGAINTVQAIAVNPPAIRGLGATGGLDFKLLDRSGGEYGELGRRTDELVDALNEGGSVVGANTSSVGLVPQVRVEVDRTRAAALGVQVDAIFSALRGTFGAFYVGDFNLFGRVYRVMMQAEAGARTSEADIGEIYVAGRDGQLVRLDTLVRVRRDHGPDTIEHFNLFRATSISGRAAPGVSSAEALDAVEAEVRETMPDQMDGAWSGLSYEERASSGYTVYIFGLGGLITFLVLAALYESWSLPMIIMFSVPPAILGGLGLLTLRGLENGIYAQIGMLLLVGLASKNAILIVEFAREQVSRGEPLVEAAIGAAGMRLRPILMTAISFIVGVLPLAFASGAGAAARTALGTTVLGGMLLTTVLSLFLVPVLFVVVGRLARYGPAVDEDDDNE